MARMALVEVFDVHPHVVNQLDDLGCELLLSQLTSTEIRQEAQWRTTRTPNNTPTSKGQGCSKSKQRPDIRGVKNHPIIIRD